MSGRIEKLRAFAEGSTVDERLADEVLAATAGTRGHGWGQARRLRALLIRAVRTAMLIELCDIGGIAGEHARRCEEDGDPDGAEALYALASILDGREENYRQWVAEAEEASA